MQLTVTFVLASLLVLFAVATLVFGAIALILKAFAALGRELEKLFGGGAKMPVGHIRQAGPLTCGNAQCGKAEHRHAAFCSQCGREFRKR